MPSLEDLKELVAASPDDPFPRYGLAMKLRSLGKPAEAIQAFRSLLERFPDYVPGRQQLAMALEAEGRIEEARQAYRAGIEAARRAGDAHAAEEMQGMLGMLG